MINLKFFGPGTLTLCFLLASCQNDLKDVQQISSKKLLIPVDKSYGVDVIYSDSAVVKAKLSTPELLHFKTAQPYYEMPKGVTVIFFDAHQKENGRVTSDYAIRKETEKIVDLKKNVVVINLKGETLKSEEVIWDESKHRFYSDKMVTVVFQDGSVLYGTGFWADENLKSYNLYQATGNINMSQKDGL